MGSSRHYIFITLLCLVSVLSLHASVYVIEGYDISIKGRTRESVVRRLVANDEGLGFTDVKDLENAVERKRQTLLDLRIFKSVDTSLGYGIEKDGVIPVTVRISIDGSISFIALPSAYYDSNYGFEAQIYLEDQNLLGTTGKAKFSFKIRENDNIRSLGNSDIISYVTLDLPVGRFWTVLTEITLQHSAKNREDSRLTYELTFERCLFENGFVKNRAILYTNPESELRQGMEMITNLFDQFQFAYNEYITWRAHHVMNSSYGDKLVKASQTALGVSLHLDKIAGIPITPSLNWLYHTNSSDPDSWTFELALDAADSLIDWYGDLRRGYRYNIASSLRLDGYRYIRADAQLFCMPFDWMQLSTRTICRIADYPDVSYTNGFTGYLRGITDVNPVIHGRSINDIFTLNLDTIIKLFRIPKFGNAYVNPFIDMGYVVPDDFLISAGFELMFILDEWPGAPGRVSYGHSLLDPDEDELTIGCYFFY